MNRFSRRTLFLASTFLLSPIASTLAAPPDRYAERPPVILSPDLTEPWVLQFQPGQRRPELSYPTHYVARPMEQANLGVAPSAQTDPAFLPAIVPYPTKERPGTIVIDTVNRYLYLVIDNGQARRYGVGVGRPGFEWAGARSITRKAQWPDWNPPKEMMARERKRGRIIPAHMEGGIGNPLGARAMYLGSSLYRIHGSNEPWTIGHAVSSGCIRMRNEDVIDLYERVRVGTRVIVI